MNLGVLDAWRCSPRRCRPAFPLGKRHQLGECLENLRGGINSWFQLPNFTDQEQSHGKVINRIAELQEKGIHIRTLDGLINTRGLGRFAPSVIGLLTGPAEVERSFIQERTRETPEHHRKTARMNFFCFV